MNLYPATVKDNNDLEKMGRIKIKVEHLHAGVDDDLLPWAKQHSLFSGGSNKYGCSNIPETDSLVWIYFENEDDFLKPYYVADIHLNQFHPHTLFDANIASHISGFTSAYPDVKYHYYKNGICIAVSSNADNPEIVTYHPSGAYSFIDSDGKIWNYSPEGIENKSGSATTEPTILGTQLKTTLENLIDTINAITVTCSAPGSPSSIPINAAAFTLIKANLSTILSQLNKNN